MSRWTLQELAKPYGDFEFENHNDYLKIEISNYGLGPMIMTNLEVIDGSNKVYTNFRDLLLEYNFIEKYNIGSYRLLNNHGVLAKEKTLNILDIQKINKSTSSNEDFNNIKIMLNKCTLILKYEDMYARPMKTIKQEISFRVI